MIEEKRVFTVGFVKESVLDGFAKVKSCLTALKARKITNEETLESLIRVAGPKIEKEMIFELSKRADESKNNPLF